MTSLVFGRGEVKALARKLDSLQHELSDDERALLVAVFAAARDHLVLVQADGSGQPGPTSDDLAQQILNAFLPAEDGEFELVTEHPMRISG
jgi:hypothetical protein